MNNNPTGINQYSKNGGVSFSLAKLKKITTAVNDGSTVDKYKAQLRSGKQLKPIQLLQFAGSSQFTLQDGNHRLTAAREAGRRSIPVQILKVDSNFRLTDITSQFRGKTAHRK